MRHQQPGQPRSQIPVSVAGENGWSTGKLVAFWLPLALSWAMMALAQPIVAAGISRLPNASTHLAAFGFTQDMAVLIESPIIMLLSASVALTRDRESYEVLRRFMLLFAGGLTTLFALTALTPLYNLIAREVVGVPVEVATASKPAMALLLPWVPAIAWRRFHQGPLISGGYPRLLTYATIFRLASLTFVVWAGTRWPLLSGTSLGALALSVSVVVEALFVTWWAWPVVRRLPRTKSPPLTFRTVLRFYLPLAGTDIMRVLSRPVMTAGIARAALPLISLAAWPVASGFIGLASSSVMAFQEMVVFVSSAPAGARRVGRFVLWIGVIVAGFVAASAYTSLFSLYLRRVIDAPQEIVSPAIASIRILATLPLLIAARNLLRGMLIAHKHTTAVQRAMGANFFSLCVLLAGGVLLGLTGIVLASYSLILSQVVEDVFLFVVYRSVRHNVLGLGKIEEPAYVHSVGSE